LSLLIGARSSSKLGDSLGFTKIAGVAGATAMAQGSQPSKTQEIVDNLHPRIATEYDFNRHKETIVTPQTITFGEHEFTWDKKETLTTDTAQSKSTLGLGWGEGGAWNNEFLRANQYFATDGTLSTAWTDAAIKGAFTIGDKDGWNLRNEGQFFGTFGDRQGYGVQGTHDLSNGDRKWGTLVWNADKAEGIGTGDSTHFGGDLNVFLTPGWSVGGAFDRVNTPEGKTDYFLARTRIDVTDVDRLGFAYELADSEVYGATHTGIGVWTHLGKDIDWGTRTIASVSRNSEQDRTGVNLGTFVVQNPTSGHGCGDAVTSRNSGDFRSHNVTSNALDIELPTTIGRSDGGWGFGAKMDYKDLAGAKSWTVGGEVGYAWNLSDDTTLSVMPFGSVTHDDVLGTGHEYGLSIEAANGNFFGMAELKQSEIGGERDTGAYFYVGFSW
jgi:hypothetical protein